MTLFLLLLALSLPQAVSPTPKAETEDDIQEAVLKYMFAHAATQQHPLTEVFFIAIEKDKDPSERVHEEI